MITITALPETVRGLPLHVLVVHAVVVLVPLAALGALGSALWPAARRHFGATAVVVAAVATVLVPVATGSGENLERRLGAEDLVRDHAHWGERMLPAMIVLLVAVLALALLDIATRSVQLAVATEPVAVGAPSRSTGATAGFLRNEESAADETPAPPLTFVDRRVAALLPDGVRSAAVAGKLRVISRIVAAIVVVAALVTLYICFKTGESGARAAWGGR
jgi:Predicted membrane protein (DUF2231)